MLTVLSIPSRDRARLDLFGFGGPEQASSVCVGFSREQMLGGWAAGGGVGRGLRASQATGGDSSVYGTAAWSYCVV